MSGVLQSLKDRLARSWNSKRGRNSTRYRYNSNAETNWNIALQQLQLQSLLPAVKEADDKYEIDEGTEGGAKEDNVQESLNQHTSKPSTYI